VLPVTLLDNPTKAAVFDTCYIHRNNKGGVKMCSKSEANQAAQGYTLEGTPVAGRTRDFHHAIPAAGASCHSQWSEVVRKKSHLMSLGHCERTVWKQLFTPKGLILKHCEGGHSRLLLLVPYNAHSTDWMKASKGARGLIIFLPLPVITKQPYCIMSVPNISKN